MTLLSPLVLPFTYIQHLIGKADQPYHRVPSTDCSLCNLHNTDTPLHGYFLIVRLQLRNMDFQRILE